MERLLGFFPLPVLVFSWSEPPEASRTLMEGPVSASCMTESREMLAARSSGRTPPGP